MALASPPRWAAVSSVSEAGRWGRPATKGAAGRAHCSTTPTNCSGERGPPLPLHPPGPPGAAPLGRSCVPPPARTRR
eukprot:scaffold16201_cov102-Isochrysis_galbana.AAC.1